MALMTTSSSPTTESRAPSSWVWVGRASSSSAAYAASTTRSQLCLPSAYSASYAGSTRCPVRAPVRASRPERASATRERAASLWASKEVMLRLRKRTSGFWKSVLDAVVKSL